VDKLRILIVKLSESFSGVWDELANDVGAEVMFYGDGEFSVDGSATAAVVVAAGGAERDGLDWLDANDRPAGLPLFVVGFDRRRRTGIQIVARGANDYFAFPEDLELARNALRSAVERHLEAVEREASRNQGPKVEAFAQIIGESPSLKDSLNRAARVLPHADATVLIVGETGTGKELLARAIHEGSDRRGAPFVPVNCSALPDNLIESELFGHERGAFTDAHSSKPGLFEVAEGGSLFLDEVGTLPVTLQAKLLRVLQDGRIRRVGGTRERNANVRIIAATNEDLKVALKNGTFRQDLYYRLGVITLTLPPLRERGEDATLIAESLLTYLAEHHGLPVPKLSADARQLLQGYHWPGNVRELRNGIERALLLSPPGELELQELLPRTDVEPTSGGGPLPFPAPLDAITAAAARATIDICDGNRSHAAKQLGISRQRLRRLLDE